MKMNHLGATLAALSLISLVFTAAEVPNSLADVPSRAATFLTYSSDDIYLTKAELKKLISDEVTGNEVSDEQMEKCMNHADIDGDGHLTNREFNRLVRFIDNGGLE